jgi:hypothetical protein
MCPVLLLHTIRTDGTLLKMFQHTTSRMVYKWQPQIAAS